MGYPTHAKGTLTRHRYLTENEFHESTGEQKKQYKCLEYDEQVEVKKGSNILLCSKYAVINGEADIEETDLISFKGSSTKYRIIVLSKRRSALSGNVAKITLYLE